MRAMEITPLTARDIEQGRFGLAATHTYLELARTELAAILEIAYRRHDVASASIVALWRDDLGELADVLDCALLEMCALSPGGGGDE